MVREWIIFALCLGAGGHVALAVILHAQDRWPWPQAGLAGLLTGLALYGLVQLSRMAWKLVRPPIHEGPDEDDSPRPSLFR